MSNEEWQKLFDRGQWKSRIIEAPLESLQSSVMDRILYERTAGAVFKGLQQAMTELNKNKEGNTMKVSYKGITGELIRLERIDVPCSCTTAQPYKWELDIWDNARNCKVSFPSVSKKDIIFLGGEVTYG